MELAQLEALVTIVDAGTFSAAADRLALTQPALTRKIQALEAECGARLLVRSRPRVEPTPTGRAVLASARRIQVEMDHLRELVAPDHSEVRGRIRAAATAIGLSYIYWPMCEAFLHRYPRVDLVFQDVEAPADGPRLVRAGAVDVAFTALPLAGAVRRLGVLHLGQVESVLFARPDHPLCAEQPVPIERLEQERLILYRRRTDTGEFRDTSWLARLGQHAAVVETGDVEYLKRLVMLGRGLSVLPWPAVAHEVTAGQLARIQLTEPDLVQGFGLVWPSGRVPRAVRALVELCRSLPFARLSAG
jgi:DNA-binding transcriptional LysR family regulator